MKVMLKTALDMINNTGPEELQKFFETASFLNESDALLDLNNDGLRLPDIASEPVEIASSEDDKILLDEFQNILEMASWSNMKVSFSPRATTDNRRNRTRFESAFAESSAMGAPDAVESNYGSSLMSSQVEESPFDVPSTSANLQVYRFNLTRFCI